ncbi:hypothetical protein C0991_011797 [Blastosporella zonata]|nr:hypothetical protein C0991_011797 [Blastosporella zonata]
MSSSSSGSIRSYQEALRYRSSYEAETTPKASSFIVAEAQSYVSRPSFESDSTSMRSWLGSKERKQPPPPLSLHDSNLHRQQSEESPVIEIIAPGPPRVESRLSLHTTYPYPDPQSITPESPDFRMPSAEEIRRRRHEKVMRTLGEPVPPELVYRGSKIPNVTVFPGPPPEATPRQTAKKLARRSSFTLSAFPNLSAIAHHTRTKSKSCDIAVPRAPEPPAPAIPKPTPPQPHSLSRQHRPPDIHITPMRATYRSATHPRPTDRPVSVYSPMVFRPGSQAFLMSDDAEDEGTPSISRMEAERSANLARRASISTAMFHPESPLRDGFRDLAPSSPRFPLQRVRNPKPSTPSIARDAHMDAHLGVDTVLSPLVFSKHSSLVQSLSEHAFTFTLSDEDTVDTATKEPEDEGNDEDEDDTPPLRIKVYAQSECGHGLLNSVSKSSSSELEHAHHSHSHSNPHLPLHFLPHTPFLDSGVPLEGYLASPGWRGGDLVQRKERRQGWSGEWNREDMQDVIKNLRKLR